MKPLRCGRNAPHARRGAALMLTFMVLLVLILILAQIKYSTDVAGRVARNEETVIAMDLAIESALLQVFEDLRTDGQADSAAGQSGAAGGDPLAGAAGGASSATDSREDAWARPQRTEINEIQLRILIQDEDSKYNVLSVLTEDEDEADKAFDRLVRVIEYARKGTDAEIDGTRARQIATAMAEYMRRRSDQVLPRPALLSDDAEQDEVGLPLTLREFIAIDPEIFTEDLFRDFVDEHGVVVHSLSSFLTVWTSIATPEEAAEEAAAANAPAQQDQGSENEPRDEDGDGQPDPPQEPTDQAGDGTPDQGGGPEAAQGGQAREAADWAVNLNTAPAAVLRALLEERALPYRFWDDVIRFRNEEDEEVEENEDPPLDEYGRPITVKKYFRTTDDLAQIDGWENLEPIVQGELLALVKTQSQVFSIYVTARRPTGEERIDPFSRQSDIEREEANWQGLVRTVRCVVWRHAHEDGSVDIVPIVRWEVLDNSPFEVLDFPGERDYR